MESDSFSPVLGQETVEPINAAWERVKIKAYPDSAVESKGFYRVEVTLP
jgi:hypothetical protein